MLSTPLPTATLRRTLFRVSATTALICRPTGMWCLSALPTPISRTPTNHQRVAADGFSKIPAMIAPTLQECYQRGVRPEATAMLPALFFVFMEQWHKGTLPYQYQDGILDAQAVHEMFEAQDPVAVYARDKALFGDLANNADFLALMREKVAAVYTLIN